MIDYIENGKRYAIWSFAGGVGKTSLTHSLATDYAWKHPDESVYVVDMSPQGDLTDKFLGGDSSGLKAKTFYEYCLDTDKVCDNSEFFIRFDRDDVPSNLFFLPACFEMNLLPGIMEYRKTSIVRSAIKDIFYSLDNLLPVGKTCFIDCPANFSILTQISLVASSSIIVPLLDGRRGVRALENAHKLLNKNDDAYGIHLNLPKIEMVFDGNIFDKEPNISDVCERIGCRLCGPWDPVSLRDNLRLCSDEFEIDRVFDKFSVMDLEERIKILESLRDVFEYSKASKNLSSEKRYEITKDYFFTILDQLAMIESLFWL